jgi:hypothetical protein
MKIGKLPTNPEGTSIPSAEISLLRWVLWFPLLSGQELVRLEQSRRGTPSGPAQPTASQVSRQVHHLVKRGLLLAFRLHEPGWPPAQQRYALSAAGVAAFAHQFQPALSLQALTRAYPIEQEDLLSRLARPFPTLVLASCFTSLSLIGDQQGWQVRAFQYPCSWSHQLWSSGSSPSRGASSLDAAWCLLHQGQQAVSLLLVVGPQQEQPFPWPVSRLLQQLARHQEAHVLESRLKAVPLVLVVSAAAHLPAWSELCQRLVCTQRPLPLGGVLLLEQVRHGGFLAAPCWRFSDLAALEESSVTVSEEAASQRQAVSVLLQEQLMMPPDQSQVSQPWSGENPTRPQAQCKQWPARQRVQRWCLPDPGWLARLTTQTADSDGSAAFGTGSLSTAARLNLSLPAKRKRALLLLARCPLLSSAQLAQLLEPTGQTRHRLQLLPALLAANLVTCLWWPGAVPRSERERWMLTETAVDYLVTRGEIPPHWRTFPAEQHLAQDGPAQMAHTHGLYACLAALARVAAQEAVIVGSWIWSTRESARRWFDPGQREWVQLRPDATWIVWQQEHPAPVRVLIEYDRATTRQRELQAKVETYIAARQQAGGRFPPVLIITTQPRAATRIRTFWQACGAPQPMLLLLQTDLDQPEGQRRLIGWLTHLFSS